MQRFLYFIVFCISCLGTIHAQTCTNPTNVILVRHAEKALDQGNDPSLTEVGKARASQLVDRLADANISALYATQFKRTQETLLPLGQRYALPVVVLEVAQSNWDVFPETLKNHILANHCGKTVVVAHHSNTIPHIINAWAGTNMKDLEDTDYGNLFLLTLQPHRKATLIRARF
ncbi:MAG: histidine phosphatase family protein [Bacteroidetes Order II. Incertae sedis bacterium]|nr:histidine phosphatase family protein [Bacteroidetes Order II. bacterium]